MSTTAVEKRYDAIKAVSERVVTVKPSGLGTDWHTRDRATVAGFIRELSKLGRTERWKANVESWACMVETEESDKDFSEWAFFQGGIWTSYAAD
jgi:hypothetical protein